MDEFAPYLKINGCFIVRNVTPDRQKTIRIFHHPILYGGDRDLLQIRGVAEADIRASLLKGELRHKILAKDIIVICSDIDLLQFNAAHKAFLQSAGIVDGLEVSSSSGGSGVDLPFLFRQNIELLGARNGINRVYVVPFLDKFIDGYFSGHLLEIQVFHNGRQLYKNIDYKISESGGYGTGYDTIQMISFTPNTHSILYANYMIKI
jgi:hypothetical protein